MVGDVGFGVPAAALDQRLGAEHRADRRGQRLGAVDDEHHAAGGVQPAVPQSGHQPGADGGVLGGALDHPQGTLVPSAVTPARRPPGAHPSRSRPGTPPATAGHPAVGAAARCAAPRSRPRTGGRPPSARYPSRPARPAGRRVRARPGRRGLTARQHPGDHPVGEQVSRGERVVGRQRQLVLIVADGADPRAADRDPAPAEGDRAVLATVPLGGPSGVVLALGPREVGDLGLHQLGHDVKADRDRGGQQPFAHVLGEPGQMPVQTIGQPLGHPGASP
jgi:hypothetical protein